MYVIRIYYLKWDNLNLKEDILYIFDIVEVLGYYVNRYI